MKNWGSPEKGSISSYEKLWQLYDKGKGKMVKWCCILGFHCPAVASGLMAASESPLEQSEQIPTESGSPFSLRFSSSHIDHPVACQAHQKHSYFRAFAHVPIDSEFSSFRKPHGSSPYLHHFFIQLWFSWWGPSWLLHLQLVAPNSSLIIPLLHFFLPFFRYYSLIYSSLYFLSLPLEFILCMSVLLTAVPPELGNILSTLQMLKYFLLK